MTYRCALILFFIFLYMCCKFKIILSDLPQQSSFVDQDLKKKFCLLNMKIQQNPNKKRYFSFNCRWTVRDAINFKHLSDTYYSIVCSMFWFFCR